MSNNITDISVIMNCFNSDKYLKSAIDSIYAQTHDSWEIIFWDNCSSDQSASIAKNYDSKLKYFLAKKKAPLGEARNLALKKAKGVFICFLDCDDLFLPKKLEIQLAAIKYSKAVLSYSGWIKINENGEEIDRFILKNEYKNKFESLLLNYNVNFQSLMIDHDYLLNNKLEFDEKVSFSPDFNLVMKIALDSPILVLSEQLVKYRVHSKSMSVKNKIDKMVDFEYTTDYLEKIGVENKYRNYKYIVLKAKYKMLFLDLLEGKNYHRIPVLIFEFLLQMTILLLGRLKHVVSRGKK
jgi:glycosyltransferase involved in cell wall biosynthesis